MFHPLWTLFVSKRIVKSVVPNSYCCSIHYQPYSFPKGLFFLASIAAVSIPSAILRAEGLTKLVRTFTMLIYCWTAFVVFTLGSENFLKGKYSCFFSKMCSIQVIFICLGLSINADPFKGVKVEISQDIRSFAQDFHIQSSYGLFR